MKTKMELLNRTDMVKKVKWYRATRELKRTVGVSEARSQGARMQNYIIECHDCNMWFGFLGC